MTAFLIGIIVLQSFAVIAFCVKWTNTHTRYRKQINGDVRMIEDLHDSLCAWRITHLALEQGYDEMQEGLEQDILSLHEQAEALHNRSEHYRLYSDLLEAYLEKHERECLPSSGESAWMDHSDGENSVVPPIFSELREQELHGS